MHLNHVRQRRQNSVKHLRQIFLQKILNDFPFVFAKSFVLDVWLGSGGTSVGDIKKIKVLSQRNRNLI